MKAKLLAHSNATTAYGTNHIFKHKKPGLRGWGAAPQIICHRRRL